MRVQALILLPTLACAAQLEVLTLPNWQRVPVGEDAMLEGGAVVARSSGPAAGYNNPAGLAGLVQPMVSGSLSLLEYTRTASRTAGGSATADQASIRPNLVGFAENIDPDDPDSAAWSFTLAAPISWDSALEVRTDTADGSRRDTGRSSLTMLVPGIGLGWKAGPAWRLGGGLEVWMAEYRYDSGTAAADSTTSLTSSFSESGRQLSLRATAGTQWVSPEWHLGLLLRSPGLRFSDHGEISASTTSGSAGGVATTTVNDTDTGFALPLPGSITAGASWRPKALDGQLTAELDLAFVAGAGDTTVFDSATGTTTSITPGGTTTAPYTLASRDYDVRWTLSPRLGMHWRLAEPVLGRVVRLHLGGYIDRSPVASSDVFPRISLLGGTAGASLERGALRTSLGMVYVTNSSLTQAFNYVTSPGAGFNPELENTDASYAVRTFILAIGTSYRFKP